MRQFISAWGRLLRGYSPLLSIEITRERPLHYPGCYAYDDNHLGGAVTLRQLRDLKGDDLVDGVLDLVRGCAVSAGLHWMHAQPLALGVRAGHVIDLSLAAGNHPPRRAPQLQGGEPASSRFGSGTMFATP